MPTYCYRVLDTSKRPTAEIVDLTFRAGRQPKRVTLKDGRRAVFDFAATVAGVRTALTMYPYTSNALGCGPEEVAKYRKAFPHHDYKDDGRIVVSSAQHRRQLARELMG